MSGESPVRLRVITSVHTESQKDFNANKFEVASSHLRFD